MTREAIADLLIQVLYPLLLSAGGYLLMLVRRWRINHIALTALANAAGAAYMTLLKSGQGVSVGAVEVAVSDGVAYASQRVPQALIAAGFTTRGDIASAVEAQLGKLLAADQTVSPTQIRGFGS